MLNGSGAGLSPTFGNPMCERVILLLVVVGFLRRIENEQVIAVPTGKFF